MTAAPVSNSEISMWLRCRRRWYLTYALRLAPRKEERQVTGVMQLGIRVHQALESDVKFGTSDGPVAWLDQIYGAELLAAPEQAHDIEAEWKLARVMLEGYVEWAAENGLDEGIEILAAESDVQVKLPGTDVTLRARLDQLIRRVSDGVILFRDWKTVGTLSQADDLIRSPQMRFYTMVQRLAAKDKDVRVDGGQVVFMVRSKRTAKATPPFYHLEEIRYTRGDLNSAYIRAKVAIDEMSRARELVETGFWQEVAIPTPLTSCSWECPFLQMCPMMDDGVSNWPAMAAQVYQQEEPYSYYNRPV